MILGAGNRPPMQVRAMRRVHLGRLSGTTGPPGATSGRHFIICTYGESRCFTRHDAYMAIGAATLFAVVVVLIWLFGEPNRASGPSTGESCVELVERFWKRPRHRPLTPVE